MEKALLVGLRLPGFTKNEIEYSLAELARLAETAGAVPEQTIIQNRQTKNPSCLIGKGKAVEIKALIKEKKLHTVIFDDELKPGQKKNLEEALEAKIIDRTRLILSIFAKRARTSEGILQVERARLEYMLPRITEHFGRFEQQTGGIGTIRGPGEKKLEVDKRKIRDKIAELDREIEEISRQRLILRQKRVESGRPAVAIVGYTNSGKSTLLNTLSRHAGIYADDKLFATLDPTTRKVSLPNGRVVPFTDTVGFIRKLPHSLVAAFRATLEEVTQANCVLHVIDISNRDYALQSETVMSVLKELGADKIPSISVYNKADLLPREQADRLRKQNNALLISAKSGDGTGELLSRIELLVTPGLKRHRFSVPYSDAGAGAASKIFNLCVVKKQKYTDKGTIFDIESSPENWERIKALTREIK